MQTKEIKVTKYGYEVIKPIDNSKCIEIIEN